MSSSRAAPQPGERALRRSTEEKGSAYVPRLRQDPTTNEWVIFATDRGKRPDDFSAKDPGTDYQTSPCAFCPGNEAATPPAVLTLSGQDSSAWSVRVVPNKFAALAPGTVGKLPMQFPEPYQDFLVETVEGCAEGILGLLQNSKQKEAFGEAGRDRVRKEFLLPRLIRDELRLIRELLDQ